MKFFFWRRKEQPERKDYELGYATLVYLLKVLQSPEKTRQLIRDIDQSGKYMEDMMRTLQGKEEQKHE